MSEKLQIPHNLINRVAALEASAKVLLDEATETKKQLEHFYALAPRKGKGLSAERKAELNQRLHKQYLNK